MTGPRGHSLSDPKRGMNPRFSRWIALTLCVAFALAVPATASAFGIRFGGKFWVKPEADQQAFAFGLQHDFTIAEDVFFINTGGTFSINDQYFLIETGLIGIRFAIPVAEGKVLPGFRGNVLMVFPIRFGPDDTSGGGFGFGAQLAPGVGFKPSDEVEIFIDFDIDIFKYLTSSGALLDGSGDAEETQVHLALMVGFRF